jgi:hypothetical protein
VICSTGWRSKGTGKSFDASKVDVWRVWNGKIIAFFEHYDTAMGLKPRRSIRGRREHKRGLLVLRTSCGI